jgi:hypothetical protein
MFEAATRGVEASGPKLCSEELRALTRAFLSDGTLAPILVAAV